MRNSSDVLPCYKPAVHYKLFYTSDSYTALNLWHFQTLFVQRQRNFHSNFLLDIMPDRNTAEFMYSCGTYMCPRGVIRWPLCLACTSANHVQLQHQHMSQWGHYVTVCLACTTANQNFVCRQEIIDRIGGINLIVLPQAVLEDTIIESSHCSWRFFTKLLCCCGCKYATV